MMDADTRARLAALETEVARLRGQDARKRRGGTWRRRGAALAVAGALGLTPLLGLAAGPTFGDLNDAAPEHRANIQAIGDAGVATGFADPNNPSARLYNPTGTVTREEMASFLARTAGLGDNPPVANAATLRGYGPSDLTGRVASRSGPPTQELPSGAGTLARLPFAAPRGGLVVVYATVVLADADGDGAPYTDAILTLREETSGGGSPRVARIGPGAGAVGRTTVTLVATFGVGPQGGNLSFALDGASGGSRRVAALFPDMTAIFVPALPEAQP